VTGVKPIAEKRPPVREMTICIHSFSRLRPGEGLMRRSWYSMYRNFIFSKLRFPSIVDWSAANDDAW